MLTRVLLAILYRSGLLQQLRGLWRDDMKAVTGRAMNHAEKAAAEALTAQRRAPKPSPALEQLAEQIDALTATCTRLERRTQGLEQVIIRNRRDAGRLVEFRRLAESGAIARHVADAIAGAPLSEDPAPMLDIDRLFPDAAYDIFLAAIPPVDAFAVKDRVKADYRARKPQAPVPDLADAVWSYLNDDLIPRTMVPAITARLAPFIAPYYSVLFGADAGGRAAALPLEPTDARLMLRRPGYHLDPHLDPKRVLMTGLLYFARPGDREAHGTTFYRVSGAITREHSSTYYPAAAGHRCELARTVPFRPNAALVFMNSAAHGADIPATAPRDLERYALQFYVGPPGEALREIVLGLPPALQQTWSQLLH